MPKGMKPIKKHLLYLLLAGLALSCSPEHSQKDHSMYWQKNAAEYHALCIQAYNLAKIKVDQAIATKSEKPLAIIADIDETVLNNLPYNEMLIETNTAFTQETWAAWVHKKTAVPIPGALEFYTHADSLGIEIIYVSNRRVENYEPTKANLISAGFPFNDDTIMLLRDKEGNKEARRNQLTNFNIALILGDNLADFDARFYKQPNEVRIERLNDTSALFGEKFILIPNLIYGSWEMGFED
jgi:5'-nucleotidase (lipoprotein e(P4) family)